MHITEIVEPAALAPETGFREAAHVTLRSAFTQMMKSADVTRAGLRRSEPTSKEIEALHDMRVGSRRLRAALSVFARVFPKSEYREIAVEIAAITDALATVRDLDVQRETLANIITELPANEAYGVERVRDRLAKQRDGERLVLIKALNRLDKSRFEKRFARALDRAATGHGKGN